MPIIRNYGPQHGMAYKVVAFFSRLQFHYQVRTFGHDRARTALFVFSAAVTALGIITLIAYLTDLPLLFPPLGPSAIILFHTPLAENACPRNVIMAHFIAVLAGLLSFFLAGAVFTKIDLTNDSVLHWGSVASIVLAIGFSGVAMVLLNCVHPPSAATAMIAAMGFLQNPIKVAGILAAVLLLVLQAIVFNRILGGLPYPLWRFDPQVIKNYGQLAGIPESGTTFWQQLVTKTFQRR